MRSAALALAVSCASAPSAAGLPAPPADRAAMIGSATALDAQAPCAGDVDCGYDPAHAVCGTNPRFNKQPPLVDQGIVCYCDEARTCRRLRVDPVPCESDESCAVRADPRPHPVASGPRFPHEKGKACVDYPISTTCERTNICTMHRHDCDRRR